MSAPLLERLAELSPEARDAELTRLAGAWRPPRLRYVPAHIELSVKQELFLSLLQREAFFGGAAGPGKSTALLAGALQYADVPGYSALILRRTFADLILPGALMDMAAEWLGPTDAKWSSRQSAWVFPSGAVLVFGYLDHEEAKRRYASSRFQFIGFDELTQFSETQYTFLFSRLRGPATTTLGRAPDGVGIAGVPQRMRSASNPGGAGHDWVNRRLVQDTTRHPGAVFIPARLIENVHLDVKGYEESLSHVGPVERERLLRGDWDVTEMGVLFRATEWMQGKWLARDPGDCQRVVRHWDWAATDEPREGAPGDPDYTVGTKMGLRPNGDVVVLDVVRFRGSPSKVEARVKLVAQADGTSVHVGLEQEPGAAGKSYADSFKRRVLVGHAVSTERPTGDKHTRAIPFASAMEDGRVYGVVGEWNGPWQRELDRIGGESETHDDQMDSASGAYTLLTKGGTMSTSRPTGRVPTEVVRRDAAPPTGAGTPAQVAAAAAQPARRKRVRQVGRARIDTPGRAGL